MKYFAKLRRTTAVVALALLAAGVAVGIGHAVQGGPDDNGGLGRVPAVQGAHYAGG